MRIKNSLLILAVALLCVPAFADQTKIYSAYEAARQALLKNSVAGVQRSAKELAAVARAEEERAIAVRADTLQNARDLVSARNAFAALSDEVIKFRVNGCCERPVVAYCSMEKKSWLQPGGPISNPYLEPSMRRCGEIVKDPAAPAHPHQH